jgi:hypothetical protein
MRISFVIVLGLLSSSVQAAETVKSVRVVLPEDATPVVKRLGQVFVRQIQQRCEAKVCLQGKAPVKVEMALGAGIGKEGYRIEDGQAGVRITGNDERGLVAGVGGFLRMSRYDNGGFTSGGWRGTSVPSRPNRGIYFATHFHNFYHEAPVPDIEKYVEDLALWGFNELVVWYDMHHFNGFEDPEAAKFRKRLHDIMAAAKRIGMDVSLIAIGNEAYDNSPQALRANPAARRGGWYDCAVCPSKPEGMEYIAFEFSPDVVTDVAGVIKTLEQNHHWRWWPGKLEGVKLDLNWFPSRGAKPQTDPGAEDAYATMRRIDGLLTPQAKKSWRWRQLYLRALLDSELKSNGGKPNDKCNDAFAELIKLYHAENANPAVRPPLPKNWNKEKETL